MDKSIKKREWNIDYLRILACVMVIFLHVSGQNFRVISVNSFEWKIFNVYDASVRSCVPIFFMISGHLFLTKNDISIKDLICKNIWKILIIYFGWSIFYAVVNMQGPISINNIMNLNFIKEVFKSEFHLWYLPALVTIYFIFPLLWSMVKLNRKDIINYICLFVMGSSLLYKFLKLPFINSNTLSILINKFLYLSFGYIGYFLWGYFLYENREKFSFTKKRWLILITVLVIWCAAKINMLYALKHGEPTTLLYHHMDMPVFIEATCLFLIFLKIPSINILKKHSYILTKISKYTLFVYVFHPFVIDQLRIQWGITSLSLNPLFGIPLLTLSIFIICLFMAFILDRVPVFNKWMM